MECLYALKAPFKNTILVSGLERWGSGRTQKLLHTKTKKMIEDLIQSQAIGTRKKRHKNLRHTGQLGAKRTRNSEDRRPC